MPTTLELRPSACARCACRLATQLALSTLAVGELRAQLVTFLSEKQVEVAAAERDSLSVSFPVYTKAGVSAAALRADVIVLTVDGRRRDELRDAFRVVFDTATKGAGSMLRVRARADGGFRTGSYELVVNVQPIDPARTPAASERHTLKLTLAGATLRPLATLVVKRTLPSLVICCSGVETARSPLVLEETGRHTRVSAVSLETRDVTLANGEPVTGRLSFTVPPEGIAPGKSFEPTYELRGDFPIGKVTGNLEIHSPQLASAVPLKYEVATKVSSLAIFWIAALGLLLGWTLRVGLEYVITRNTTRLQALRLIQRIEAERSQRPDATLRGALDAIVVELRRAMQHADATTLAASITTADADRATALQRFATRQVETQAAIDKLQGELTGNWSVPEPIARAIREAQAALARARALVVGGNLDGANTALVTIRGEFTEIVTRGAAGFRGDLLDGITGVGGTTFALPQAALGVLKQIGELAEAIPAGEAHPDPTAILNAVHVARAKTSLALEAFGRILGSFIASILAPLKAIERENIPAPDELDALARDTDALQARLRASANLPETSVAALRPDLDQLRDELGKTLIAQTQRVDPKQDAANKQSLADIAAALTAGKYADAGLEVAKFVRRNAGLAGVGMMGGATAKAAAPSDQPVELGAAPAVTSGRVMTQIITTVQEPIEVETARTIRELAKAKGRQTLVAGILIALAGYAIFQESFSGTIADVASVFFWAFTLDLSVATLATLAGKISPPR